MTDSTQQRSGRKLKNWARKVGLGLSAIILPVGFRKTQKFPFFEVNFDRTIKKGIVYFAFYSVFVPLTTFLFPRAETVLKRQGLDPKLAEQMAPGENIYVRPNNILGKAHYLFGAAPIYMWPVHFTKLSDAILPSSSTGAFTLPEETQPGLIKLIAPHTCTITFNCSAEKFLRDVSRLKTEQEAQSHGMMTFEPPVTPQEIMQYILLHELRHCNNDNNRLEDGFAREADADFESIRHMAVADKNKSRMIQRFLDYCARPVDQDEDHNTVLYLYYRFTGGTVPATRDIKQANANAIKIVDSIDRGLPVDDKLMSDTLTMQRIALFLNAGDKSFVPTKKSHSVPRPR